MSGIKRKLFAALLCILAILLLFVGTVPCAAESTAEDSAERVERLLDGIYAIIERAGLDTESLVSEGECPVFDKFDEYIPPHLLRLAYAADRLLAGEITDRFNNTEMYI